jgi:tRNA1(Val) A37 N6-methylase TrmN6
MLLKLLAALCTTIDELNMTRLFICLFILMDYDTAMSQKQDIFTLLSGKVLCLRGSYNPTSDAVWLAAFATSAKTVLDVGCGTGGVALSYMHHHPDSFVTGIDISDERLAECADNAKLNNRDLELLNQDIMTWKTDRVFDLVVTNPPYFKGTPAKHDAHHNVDLSEWVKRCLARVRPRGHFCTIVDSAVIADVISVLSKTCGDVCLFPLFGAKNTAERVLIRARLGVKGGTTLYSGLSMNSELILRQGLTIKAALATLRPVTQGFTN